MIETKTKSIENGICEQNVTFMTKRRESASNTEGGIIIADLMWGHPKVWHRWCERVNDETAPELLSELMFELTTDAARLLDDIDNMKAKDISQKAIRVERDSRLPRPKVRKTIKEAMGEYDLEAVATFDDKRGNMNQKTSHNYDAPVDQLVGFGMGIAVMSGQWRNFRRCLHPYCLRYFYQHTETGGRIQRYCTPSHRSAHAQLIKRHGE